MVPVLMITYGRLAYTKKALEALFEVKGIEVCVVDNASTDGTKEWLKEQQWECKQHGHFKLYVLFLNKNIGVAGAMNWFLSMTKRNVYVAKVDNDTIIPPDFIERMLPHMAKADIVQAKHPLLKATHEAGFDDWVKTMKADGALRYHHFVGGSGILFKRSIVDKVPETDWVLGGWRQFQREHPELKKAFATDVEIQLLDTDETGAKYEDYKDYYIETKRL